MTDAEILGLRICDLPLKLRRSPLHALVLQLHREMRARDFVFLPTCYLSTEWFVDKHAIAIGIPFCLAHPRLLRLERRILFDVEGDTREEAIRILRHEAGHALDHAYRLHLRRQRQQIFGKSSAPYPETYAPRPYSRSYVRHLENWYAQSHPDEDFAETFAVWLRPHGNWKQRYRNWKGALRKLQYLDDLMKEVAKKPPPVVSGRRPHAIWTVRQTVQELYEERLASLERGANPEFVDADLQSIFAMPDQAPNGEPAWRFVRRHRRTIREAVSRWAVMKKYNVDAMLSDMMGRCRELDLRRVSEEHDTLLNLVACCVSLSKNYLFAGQFSMGT